MEPLIETERLIIRHFTLDDAPFILELVNTPSWLAYIGNRNVNNIDDARKYLQNGPLKSYADNGYGGWMIQHKEQQVPIGQCGLYKRSYLTAPDVGFAFLPQHEGLGYGQEAVRATLTWAQHQLKINNLFAIVQPNNERSIRLLEKTGFIIQDMIRPEGNTTLALYCYTAPE